MEKSWTVIIPARPQPDTLVAVFLLKRFGQEKFPGIESLQLQVNPTAPHEPFEQLLAEQVIALDIGGGPLDHHNTGLCASELVAKMLGIEDNPAIAKLVAYAKRDDAHGKGTLSTDGIDRAFGLSGLISALNKQYVHDPQRIMEIVMPLLEAHYYGAHEHHVVLPREVSEKKTRGEYEEYSATQGGKRLKVAFVVSDKPSMPTYLRSAQGPAVEVVVQKAETGNKIAILSRQDRRPNLAGVAALIRMREAELRGVTLPEESAYWAKEGRIDELPMWYLDPATNSLLNVGTTPDDESRIPFDELKRLVPRGLEVVPPRIK